jgi:hypothetical protein
MALQCLQAATGGSTIQRQIMFRSADATASTSLPERGSKKRSSSQHTGTAGHASPEGPESRSGQLPVPLQGAGSDAATRGRGALAGPSRPVRGRSSRSAGASAKLSFSRLVPHEASARRVAEHGGELFSAAAALGGRVAAFTAGLEGRASHEAQSQMGADDGDRAGAGGDSSRTISDASSEDVNAPEDMEAPAPHVSGAADPSAPQGGQRSSDPPQSGAFELRKASKYRGVTTTSKYRGVTVK